MKKSSIEDPQFFKITLDPDTNQIPGGFSLNLLLRIPVTILCHLHNLICENTYLACHLQWRFSTLEVLTFWLKIKKDYFFWKSFQIHTLRKMYALFLSINASWVHKWLLIKLPSIRLFCVCFVKGDTDIQNEYSLRWVEDIYHRTLPRETEKQWVIPYPSFPISVHGLYRWRFLHFRQICTFNNNW